MRYWQIFFFITFCCHDFPPPATTTTSQAFVFFFAGFETTSSALTSAMYELALNPGVQKKLQFEIDDVRKKHDGEITYESLTEMQYLNSVVQGNERNFSFYLFVEKGEEGVVSNYYYYYYRNSSKTSSDIRIDETLYKRLYGT